VNVTGWKMAPRCNTAPTAHHWSNSFTAAEGMNTVAYAKPRGGNASAGD